MKSRNLTCWQPNPRGAQLTSATLNDQIWSAFVGDSIFASPSSPSSSLESTPSAGDLKCLCPDADAPRGAVQPPRAFPTTPGANDDPG